MARPRRRNPSSLVIAGSASAFLAVAVGAWLFARKAALAQVAAEEEAAKKERSVASLKGFVPQGPNTEQLARLSTSRVRPFQSSTAAAQEEGQV